MTAYRANLAVLTVLLTFALLQCERTRWARAATLDADGLALEERFATQRNDPVVAEALVRHYLEQDIPRRAIMAMTMAQPEALSDPAVQHWLSVSYERAGRLDDAIALATTAANICASERLHWHPNLPPPTPESRACSHGLQANAMMHLAALLRMKSWGVQDPSRDGRANQAYRVTIRQAGVVH